MTAAITAASAVAAATDPRARTMRLTDTTGHATATIVVMPDGEGYVMGHSVPDLPRGRTYQLWAMTGDPTTPRLVSAGVLGRSLDVVAFHGPGRW